MRAPLLLEAVIGLRVAVAASDPVRHADLAARVALAGHSLADDEEAEIVLTDEAAPVREGMPVLRMGRGGMPPSLTPAQLDAALRAVRVGLRVSLEDPSGFGPAEPARALLTPREMEILRCLADGMSNKSVARALGISAHTVKFHLEAVFAKLGVASRAEAVAKGLRQGLILL